MKKNYLLLTLLLICGLFVSCMTEREIPHKGGNNADAAIQFSVAGDDFEDAAGTRATTVTTAGIVGQNFNLWGTGVLNGVNAGTTTFNHKMKVESSTSVKIDETTPPTYYWPVSGTPGMKFIGLYPYDAGTTGVTVATPAVSRPYTVSGWNAPDMLYTNQTITAKPSDNKVNITFYHALTKVTFSLKLINNTANVPVKVSSIQLSGLKTTRTFSLTSAGFEWSATPAATGSATVAASGETANTVTAVGTDTQIWSTGGHFIVMPVDDHPAGVSVTVVFNVNGSDVASITKPLPTSVGVSDATKWQAGRWINYQLEYYADKNGPEMTFGGITVAPWGAVQNVPVPVN